MSFHADLLDQAEHLARLDPRRPKQVNLRRAISSAYYALFHLLAAEASSLYAAEPEIASRISRTLNHGEMKKTSLMIANGKLPRAIQLPSGGYSAPADLKVVAKTFVSLQEARHEADYDVSRIVKRQEVLESVESARQAFGAWERIRKTDDARFYLACFHLWKRWDEEPR
jgi:uncharacterized protein (UPF0332 family)